MNNEQKPLQPLPAATNHNSMTPSAPPSTSHRPPDSWIERIFTVMSARFGRHFADMWGAIPADDMKAVWADDLAGFTGDEIKRGLDGCKCLKFPPTLPEFLQLCRPSLDYETAYQEAVREMLKRRQPFQRDGSLKTLDKWSHPSIYWAAAKLGHDLLNLPYVAVKARWKQALDDARAEGRQDVPAYAPALPAPGKVGMLPEEWQKKIAELRVGMRMPEPPSPFRIGQTVVTEEGRAFVVVGFHPGSVVVPKGWLMDKNDTAVNPSKCRPYEGAPSAVSHLAGGAA